MQRRRCIEGDGPLPHCGASRERIDQQRNSPENHWRYQFAGYGDGGQGWIRTSVRLHGQIYSLLPLTTRPPVHRCHHDGEARLWRSRCGLSTKAIAFAESLVMRFDLRRSCGTGPILRPTFRTAYSMGDGVGERAGAAKVQSAEPHKKEGTAPKSRPLPGTDPMRDQNLKFAPARNVRPIRPA